MVNSIGFLRREEQEGIRETQILIVPLKKKRKPEPAPELVAETQVIRPSKLDVQASYKVEAPQEVAKPIETGKDEKETRLKRWQDRLKNQSTDKPTKDTKPYLRMRAADIHQPGGRSEGDTRTEVSC